MNQKLIDFLAAEFSDLETGPLSDSPYKNAEPENDGSLSLFLGDPLESFPDAGIDLPQLADAIERWMKAQGR